MLASLPVLRVYPLWNAQSLCSRGLRVRLISSPPHTLCEPRVQRRLGEIQKAANTVCERLEQDTSERQGLLLASLQTVERGHSEAQGLFRDVEAKTATLTQAATRHGNRLKVRVHVWCSHGSAAYAEPAAAA